MRQMWWLLLCAGIAACSMKSTMSGGSTTTPSAGPGAPAGDDSQAPMPDLTGKTAEQATAALRAAGFTGELEVDRAELGCDVNGGPTGAGQIRCQRPEAGTPARRDGLVSVMTAKGRTALGRAELDKAKGMTVDEAKQYFKSIGFDGTTNVYEQPAYQPYKNCAQGHVCDAGPGDGISLHGELTLFVNAPPP